MKVILDTNVLVSGIFFKGPPHRILVEWKKGRFQLVASHAILDEYKRIVEGLSVEFPTADATEAFQKIALGVHLTFAIALPAKVCDDPDDDKFFAAAIASKTDIVVSGDKHLLSKSGYSGVTVLRPADFVRTYIPSEQ
jgi:uncharacterized protein